MSTETLQRHPVGEQPHRARPRAGARVARCIALAFAITALHLGLLLGTAAPGGTWSERYHKLVAHDSEWFLNIIARGYQSPIPPSPQKRMEVSNVAFFPGFPLWGEAVIKGLGLHPRTGLTLASHVATWGFWTYLLLFARRIGLGRGTTAAVVALIVLAAAHAFTDLRPHGAFARAVVIATALLALAGAYLHFTYAAQFMRGGWVA